MEVKDLESADSLEDYLAHNGFDSVEAFLKHEGFDTIEEYLAHYGILGMKWGVRRNRGADGTVGGSSKLAAKINRVTNRISPPSGPEPVRVQARPGQRVRAQGGRNVSPSEDAKRAAAMRQIGRSSTVDALSNKQLEALLKRMNLERQYAQMNPPTGAKAFIRKFLKQNGKDLVPLGYEVATTVNPALAKNTKVRVGMQVMALAAGGKLPAPKKEEQKKEEQKK